MIDNQLPPEEQKLVQQIQDTPKPKIDPATREAIRQRMVSEFRAGVGSNRGHFSSARPHFPIHRRLVWGAAGIMVIVGLVIIQLGHQNTAGIVGTLTLTTLPGNQVAVVPSETITATVERETLTPVVTLIPSLTTESAINTPTTTQSAIQIGTSLPPIATQEMVINIEGPITSIVDNIVTIYSFRVEVEPQNPILKVIDVGDVVRVKGVQDSSGTIIASVISNIPDETIVSGSTATVGLDGPVEAINGNTIIVNSIPVQLVSSDPLLQTIQVGNFVSVQGNFQISSSSIVLVVANIAIINSTTIQNDCSYHVDAMGMGHWHCDGMGMGDDGMGMGAAMGMGE